MSRLRIALVVLVLAACGRSAGGAAVEATRELRSWDSTTRLTEDAVARGAIPVEFAEQVRRAAAQERPAAEAQRRDAEARARAGAR